MDSLYQKIILNHNRNPQNKGALDGHTHFAEGKNTICGDELAIYLQEKKNSLERVQFTGQGCAICIASASLLTTHLQGFSLELVREEIRRIQTILNDTEEEAPDLSGLGDVAALAGVRSFPARLKCALLAWEICEVALVVRQV